MVKELYDQYQELEKKQAELAKQMAEVKSRIDQQRIKRLDAAGIKSDSDLEDLLTLRPTQENIEHGEDCVVATDGSSILLKGEHQQLEKTGYIMYQLDNGNIMLVKADDQKGIQQEFDNRLSQPEPKEDATVSKSSNKSVASVKKANHDVDTVIDADKPVKQATSKVTKKTPIASDVVKTATTKSPRKKRTSKLTASISDNLDNHFDDEGEDDMDKYRSMAKAYLTEHDDEDESAASTETEDDSVKETSKSKLQEVAKRLSQGY